MKTRSQTNNIDIDFDEASKAWRQNKKEVGQGHFKYVCIKQTDGVNCGKACYKNIQYCWSHRGIGYNNNNNKDN